MIKWLKKQMLALSLAMSNVEKNAITQTADSLADGVQSIMDVNEGRLSNDMMKGKITKQVHQMRWRMYKVLFHSQMKRIEDITDGKVKMSNVDLSKALRGLDLPDNLGDVRMVINNREESLSMSDMVGVKDKLTKPEMDAMMKVKRRISITRELLPKFELENYTERLIVTKIDEKKCHLDFYINKYSDIYDKRTPFLIKEVEKAMKNPRLTDMLNIDNLGFITNKDVGVEDFLEFLYKVDGFKEIINFKGYYIIRFTAESVIDGNNILEDFVDHELDIKYERKEKK